MHCELSACVRAFSLLSLRFSCFVIVQLIRLHPPLRDCVVWAGLRAHTNTHKLTPTNADIQQNAGCRFYYISIVSMVSSTLSTLYRVLCAKMNINHTHCAWHLKYTEKNTLISSQSHAPLPHAQNESVCLCVSLPCCGRKCVTPALRGYLSSDSIRTTPPLLSRQCLSEFVQKLRMTCSLHLIELLYGTAHSSSVRLARISASGHVIKIIPADG